MATLKNSTVSRFHNLSDEALADAIGRADAIVKGAEAELAALKDEFKARGLSEVAGDEFAVTRDRTDFGPDRHQGREGAARRAIQRVRKGHHLHRDPHQGGQSARARGLTEAAAGR